MEAPLSGAEKPLNPPRAARVKQRVPILFTNVFVIYSKFELGAGGSAKVPRNRGITDETLRRNGRYVMELV